MRPQAQHRSVKRRVKMYELVFECPQCAAWGAERWMETSRSATKGSKCKKCKRPATPINVEEL